jgi:putative transposase
MVRSFEGICIEDLYIKSLAKTKQAKSWMDAAHGEFRRQLAYKALWYGKRLVIIDRFFPSSKRCNNCGYINHDLELSDREWRCPQCSVLHDRDHNASLNIRDEGLRILAAGDRTGKTLVESA